MPSPPVAGQSVAHAGPHRIEFESSGEAIRIVTESSKRSTSPSREERLRLFDEATRRIRERARDLPETGESGGCGWKLEDPYRRGSSD